MDKPKPSHLRPPLAQALPRADAPAPGASDEAWQAYRKWLGGGASGPRSRRPRGETSLYSWKGYHSWAEKIRRSWDNEQ